MFYKTSADHFGSMETTFRPIDTHSPFSTREKDSRKQTKRQQQRKNAAKDGGLE